MPNACAAARTMNADKVLDVAVTAYWQGDPSDMSMNTICQMAGVSKLSVYREDGMTCAALNRDAVQVLSDIFAILHRGAKLEETLNALNEMGAFACSDPRMKTGCLFCKLRVGKYRLGPETRTRVEEIDAAAQAAYAAFLQSRRDGGDWPGGLSVAVGATHLAEHIGLAITQRTSDEDPARIREMLGLAPSEFTRP